MENATKALIIAAAVLVAIIIISLTLGVVNQGTEAMQGADMSEAEKAAFNSKFLAYEGRNVSTSDVNALLSTALSHNQNEAEKDSNLSITVTVDGSEGAAPDTPGITEDRVIKVTGSSRYTVTCVLTNGLVSAIEITTNP